MFRLLTNKLELVRQMSTMFTMTLIQAGDGETDPRNEGPKNTSESKGSREANPKGGEDIKPERGQDGEKRLREVWIFRWL